MQERRLSNLLTKFVRSTTLAAGILLTVGISAQADSDGYLTASAASFTATTGNSYTPDNSGSYAGLQNKYWNYSPDQGQQTKNWQTKKTSGTGAAPDYTTGQQGGMTSGQTSGFTVQTPTPQTVATDAQSGESVPHQPLRKEITLYTNPAENNWGPPKNNPVYQHISAFDAPMTNDSQALMQNGTYTAGATVSSDLVTHALSVMGAQKTANAILNPSLHSAQAQYQGGTQQSADGAGGAAAGQLNSNLQTFQQSLINVANEVAGAPTDPNAPHKTLEQAVWMVQQMLKRIYIPMAILLLLPGAVATQMQVVIKNGFTNEESDPELHTPFPGLLRMLIALFLIPATQLIVSYSIDVGNSMTYEVTQFINTGSISTWTGSLSLANPTPANATPTQIQQQQIQETTMTATMRAAFSGINTLLNGGIMVLLAYQVVMACYLLLMGPISAALFAWPGGVGRLFKPVFSNWLEALFNLVLWRFWWCVILLCMSTRIQWLMEVGSYNPSSQWENYTYMAFMAMLTYVPFMALDFKTDSMVDQLLEKTGGNGGGTGHGAGRGAAPPQIRPRTT